MRAKNTDTRAPNYISFMLRLYRVDDKEEPVWRISLESTRTQEQVGFASLQDLYAFLRQQMYTMSDADRGSDETHT